MRAIQFENGDISSAIGQDDKEAMKEFRRIYGGKPQGQWRYVSVVMEVIDQGDRSSMRWVEAEDLSAWCAPKQSVRDALSLAASKGK